MTAPLALSPQEPLTFDAAPDHLAHFASVSAAPAVTADVPPPVMDFTPVPPDPRRAELFDLALDLRRAGVEEPLVREIVFARAGPAGTALAEDVLASATVRAAPRGPLEAVRAAMRALLLDAHAVESARALRATWALTGEVVQWDLRSTGHLGITAMDVVGDLKDLCERIWDPPPSQPPPPRASPAVLLRALRGMYGRWRQSTPPAEHDDAGLDQESAPTRLVKALLFGPVRAPTLPSGYEVTTAADCPGADFLGQGVRLNVDRRSGEAVLTVNVPSAAAGVLARHPVFGMGRMTDTALGRLLGTSGRVIGQRRTSKRFHRLTVTDLIDSMTGSTGSEASGEPVEPVEPAHPSREGYEEIHAALANVAPLNDAAEDPEPEDEPQSPGLVDCADLVAFPLAVW